MSRTLSYAGFILALIGSIILIIVGIAGLFGIFFLIFYPVYALASVFYGLAMLIIGILCAVSSRFVHRIGPAIWLIILAIIAILLGSVFAAWLILIGAILGLISRL